MVRARPGVEHDGRAALPVDLVLAHEQLVVAGGRRPVDTAEVVADDVLAQGVEVVAGRRRQRRLAHAGERLVAAGGGRREDLVDAGQHRQLGAGRGVGPHLGEAERVGDDDVERADGDEARGARSGGGRRSGP